MAKIGFIGLGAMGLCMARNLLSNGHEVIGFDFSKVAMDAHVEKMVAKSRFQQPKRLQKPTLLLQCCRMEMP